MLSHNTIGRYPSLNKYPCLVIIHVHDGTVSKIRELMPIILSLFDRTSNMSKKTLLIITIILVRPAKINCMFYLSSRVHFAKNSRKNTQTEKYTIFISFTFSLVLYFVSFSLGLETSIPCFFNPI